jgi:hypothetical protein
MTSKTPQEPGEAIQPLAPGEKYDLLSGQVVRDAEPKLEEAVLGTKRDDNITFEDKLARFRTKLALALAKLDDTRQLLLAERQPHVGDMVLYHLVKGTGSRGIDYAPAIITEVHSAQCVSMTVYPDFAAPFHGRQCWLHTRGHSTVGKAWSWGKFDE